MKVEWRRLIGCRLFFSLFKKRRMRDFRLMWALLQKETKRREIDFIANMGSKRYYIQSAFHLPDEEKVKREKAYLLNVNDSLNENSLKF